MNLRSLIGGLLFAVFAAFCHPALAQQAQSYSLLANASASGPVVLPLGGNYVLSLGGTFGGATLTLSETVSGASSTLGTYASAPATAPCFAIPAGAIVQMTVSGGSPSGLYATLGGVGSGGCGGTPNAAAPGLPANAAQETGGNLATTATKTTAVAAAAGTTSDTPTQATIEGFLEGLWSIFNTNAPATAANQTATNSSLSTIATNTTHAGTPTLQSGSTTAVTPSSPAVTDLSGAITTGNTFQTLDAAWARSSFEFQNICSVAAAGACVATTDNCYLSFRAATFAKATSLLVAPGAYYGRSGVTTPGSLISVTCDGTGDKFWAQKQ